MARLYDPFDSIRVLKAAFDDLVEQLDQLCKEGGIRTNDGLSVMQAYVDGALWNVKFRGVNLVKLISVELELNHSVPPEVIVYLRARSEDGHHYLEQMQLQEYQNPNPKKLANQPVPDEPPVVRRVIEL